MTDLTRDDVRAAVRTGVLDEQQAATLFALSETRAGMRSHMSGLDEPFELFRGFNEVFIVVGLVILYGGFNGFTGLSNLGSSTGYILGMIYPAIAMVGLVLLARYFTLTRRMIAPSIALAIMFGISAVQFGYSLAASMNMQVQGTITLSAALCGVLLVAYYTWFRVPFTVALIALSVLAMTFGLAAVGGAVPTELADFFLLTADGPFALITVALGVIGAGVALWMDMQDPHRVTRRSAGAFWLHVLAAPAIVNTVALTLFEEEASLALVILALFLALMALFAVVTDRRSFLVAGVGYVVALAFTVAEGGAFFLILLLGAGLVLLGAQWDRLRRAIMTALPAFPGKDRLPPYAFTDPERPTE